MTPPFAAPARGVPETDQCHRRADIRLRRGERKIHLCHCGIFVCFETIDNINCYKVARARLDKEGGEVYSFRNFHIHFKCLTFTKNIITVFCGGRLARNPVQMQPPLSRAVWRRPPAEGGVQAER